jgi:hypothetical protein
VRSLFPFIALIALASPALAGQNPCATLVLHAVPTDSTHHDDCAIAGGDPCWNESISTVATPGERVTVYLLAYEHNLLAGLQTAFEWDPSWCLEIGLWDCQVDQVSVRTPRSPGGPQEGTLTTAFDVVTSPAATVIGRMIMRAGQGALSLVESNYPGGTHVTGADGVPDQLPGSRLGRIDADGQAGYAPCPEIRPTIRTWICCVDDQCVTVGYDGVECAVLGGTMWRHGACEIWCAATPPCVVPVEPFSWGAVKHTYR